MRSLLPAIVLVSSGWWTAAGYGQTPLPRAVIAPTHLAAAPDGSILVADPGSLRIWRIRGAELSIVAGSGRGGESADGTSALDARLVGLGDVVEDRAGNVYFVERAQSPNATIRKIDRRGLLSTIALPHEPASANEDDRPTSGFISALAVDAGGNLFVAERMAGRIRKVDPSGVVTTVLDEGLTDPSDLVFDRQHQLLVASGAEVLAIDVHGKAARLAGSGEPGYSGDGGAATRAQFSRFLQLGAAPSGALMVADFSNDRVRTISPDGVVSTLAAVPQEDKDAECTLCPMSTAVSADGTTYVTTRSGLMKIAGKRFTPVFAAPSAVVRKLKPTREAFLSEVLDAEYTLVTRRFDAYTEGSYQVDKLDVYKGLEEQARRTGRRLRGVLVVGPSGILWAYSVTAFFDEGEQVRANRVVMPHARITWKGTALLTRAQYADLMSDLRRTALVKPTPPPAKKADLPYPEWAYGVLVVDFSAGEPKVGYGGIDLSEGSADVDKFLAVLNPFESLFKMTYGM